jgi:predicted ATP-dependent serine protease
VLYLNMEMSLYDVGKRVVVHTLQKPYDEFKTRNLFHDAEYILEQRKLYVSNGKDLSVSEIAALAKYYHTKQQIKFLIVDYDQKIKLHTSRDSPEWKQLQLAMIEMETIAKELQLHVMVLAQTNNEGEISGSRRSMFPASTVLKFSREDDDTVTIRAVKNRFGPHNACVQVDYDASMAMVREVGNYIPTARKL